MSVAGAKDGTEPVGEVDIGGEDKDWEQDKISLVMSGLQRQIQRQDLKSTRTFHSLGGSIQNDILTLRMKKASPVQMKLNEMTNPGKWEVFLFSYTGHLG